MIAGAAPILGTAGTLAAAGVPIVAGASAMTCSVVHPPPILGDGGGGGSVVATDFVLVSFAWQESNGQALSTNLAVANTSFPGGLRRVGQYFNVASYAGTPNTLAKTVLASRGGHDLADPPPTFFLSVANLIAALPADAVGIVALAGSWVTNRGNGNVTVTTSSYAGGALGDWGLDFPNDGFIPSGESVLTRQFSQVINLPGGHEGDGTNPGDSCGSLSVNLTSRVVTFLPP